MNATDNKSGQKLGAMRRLAIMGLGKAGVFVKKAVALGQTRDEMEAICGPCPRPDILRGIQLLGFELPGFNVIAAMESDKSAVLLFQRSTMRFFANEIRAFLEASAGGSRWMLKDGSDSCWTREDGAAFALLSEDQKLFIYDGDAGARIVADFLATL